MYQGVRNMMLSENSAYMLIELSLILIMPSFNFFQ